MAGTFPSSLVRAHFKSETALQACHDFLLLRGRGRCKRQPDIAHVDVVDAHYGLPGGNAPVAIENLHDAANLAMPAWADLKSPCSMSCQIFRWSGAEQVEPMAARAPRAKASPETRAGPKLCRTCRLRSRPHKRP